MSQNYGKSKRALNRLNYVSKNMSNQKELECFRIMTDRRELWTDKYMSNQKRVRMSWNYGRLMRIRMSQNYGKSKRALNRTIYDSKLWQIEESPD